jgi:hypothetical protein
LLFDEVDLRTLAARFEADLERGLRTRKSRNLEFGVYKAVGAISSIANVLQDPDLSTNATLRLSPDPNDLQKADIAERYIRFGRPAEALRWLEGDWSHRDDSRQRLLADAYAALGDDIRLRAVRQALFERTGSTSDFEFWRQSLPSAERAPAVEAARSRAKNLHDPVSAAELLLHLNDDAEAEELLVNRQGDIRGEDYGRLVPIARMMKKNGRVLGAIVCYRALLVAILARGYAKAYGHAASYLVALRRLDANVTSYGPLARHHAFESSIRNAHKRKASFWNRIPE